LESFFFESFFGKGLNIFFSFDCVKRTKKKKMSKMRSFFWVFLVLMMLLGLSLCIWIGVDGFTGKGGLDSSASIGVLVAGVLLVVSVVVVYLVNLNKSVEEAEELRF
jgi:hypothetical protein